MTAAASSHRAWPPSPLLYELVGLGMAGYARVAHRVVGIGLERLQLRPGAVLVCTHLSDADVPVVAGSVYRAARLCRRGELSRPAFAARNDLLLPGYLAGYPRGLPIPLRRVLYPLDIGPVMTGHVRCLPIRFADRMRLVEALRARPEIVLETALEPVCVAALRERAARLARPVPQTAADVLDGAYADLLWRDVTRAELDPSAFAAVWDRRRAQSAIDVRRIVRHVRGGGSLVIFPHGEAVPDGAVAPLDARVGRLLEMVRASILQPIGVAYDPLVAGRPQAFVAAGQPLALAPRRDPSHAVLDGLRRATPLSCGLVLAHEAVGSGAMPTAAAAATTLERALERASADGRPVDPALSSPAARAARLEQARAALRRLGWAHPWVRRAARTYATAIEPAA